MIYTLPQLSQRGKNLPVSPIRKLIPFADAAKKKGIKVYHINIGDPDFEAPIQITSALKKIARDTKAIPYANSRGELDNREAWVKYYSQVGIKVTPENIVVTTGGSEALIMILASVLDPDDEYLVFEPFYPNYAIFGHVYGAKPVAVALDNANGYHLPTDREIVEKINRKTKAILFTNPNNPTGTVFSKDEIERVLAIAKKYNLWVISDETYRGMTFGNSKSLSVFNLAKGEERKRLVVADSLSKRFNICGARVGAVVSENEDLIAAVVKSAQSRLSSALLEQKLVTPMLKDCLPYVKSLAKKYEKRRDVFLSTLEKELGVKIHRPEGAFYTMVQLPVKNSEDFAKFLLSDFSDKKETVMVAPGYGFYATPRKGLNEIRVAYVLNEKSLKRAAELLGLALKKYNSIQSH